MFVKQKTSWMLSIEFGRVLEVSYRMSCCNDVNGDINTSINTAKASIASMMKPVEVEFQNITTDDIRKRRMTPKQLVDWFLESHIHFITKSLMLSPIKNRRKTGNELGFWVSY